MRTKTLLLTAALCAAGAATSMAQVYSVNMVGYINQQIPQGFSMIANHLNNSPDNRAITLFPTAAVGTRILKFNGTGFDSMQMVDEWEGNLTITLNPGEAAYYFAPAALTHTFVGEVALNSTVALPPGWSMVSSALPQSLPLDGAPPAGLGFPVANGDRVARFNPATQNFIPDQYLDNQWDDGTAPVPNVGEGFYVFNAGAAKNWTRSFSVSGQ